MSLQANAAALAHAQKTDPDAYELPVEEKEGVSNPDGLFVSDRMKKVWVVEAKATPRVCARLFATL